jgi:zinc/manganese transport system substrate-binding protein
MPLCSRLAMTVVLAAALASACSPGSMPTTSQTLSAVGVENEYANVIQQIGGPYVHVAAIMNNPNTDPHTFEASPTVVREVANAQLVVQNGLGYDAFMNTIETAAPGPRRKVIEVQELLGLPRTTANPHLWYKPDVMPEVASAIARDLAALDPSHAAAFQANERRFVASLAPWGRAIAAFRARYRGIPVASTEPVADYLLQALGANNLTPWALQVDIMNGVDPSPEDIAVERSLFTEHRVRVLVYNQQVTDPLTQSFLQLARSNGLPVVGAYETMPEPGYDYQSWMVAEVHALQKAVESGISTMQL